MPVTTTYPGIYIEELPSTTKTIAAAPTSVAVFVGYSHPYRGAVAKKRAWGQAVKIFNFTEYERHFGGLFRSDGISSDLPYAVQQFFLNGGSVAYVVGLQPKVSGADFPKPTGKIDEIAFTGLEPLSPDFALTVTVDNVQEDKKTADVTITYGARAESFRRVSLDSSDENFIEHRLNGVSNLVEVAAATSAGYKLFTSTATKKATLTCTVSGSVYKATDYTDAFKAEGSLDKVDIFNLMALPGVADPGVLAQALAFCEKKRAFLLMDPPINASADGMQVDPSTTLPKMEDLFDGLPKSPNGAIYFPYLTSIDGLTGKVVDMPPSGYVAGIFARTDNNRGVWKAPAGIETTLLNATGVTARGRMTEGRAGVLNDKGINAIRTFPDIGTVVFGARTLVGAKANTAFQQWRYVPVRRMALFIEQTLYANLGWAVFEPNDEPLWIAIRTSIERFMLSLFRQGAFQGQKPSEAFLVKCDSTTTTQQDIDNGIVNVYVGFCPLKPAEFVIIKIAQLAGQVQA